MKSEVMGHCKPDKRTSYSERQPKNVMEIVVGVFKDMSHLKRKIKVNAFVFSVLTPTKCPEYP
jgi:hypothetical protein